MSNREIYVQLKRKGAVVRDPRDMQQITERGRWVPDSTYWRRHAADGAITISNKAPADAEPQREPVAEEAEPVLAADEIADEPATPKGRSRRR